MLTEKLDHLVSHDAAATDVKPAPRPARAELLFERGPGYVLLSDGACFADVNRVAS